MSLFLGKIHYWLFNKILWYEAMENELTQWALSREIIDQEWLKNTYDVYGRPIENKALEEIIDTGNIHGWLQERIRRAELRQASLITKIVNTNPAFIKDITDIYIQQGKAAADSYTEDAGTPESIFNAIHDFVLEGMPCDRVNEMVSNNKDEIVWKITTCLHRPYWEEVNGNIQNFYDLREAWVQSFVKALNPAFRYERLPDAIHKIVKEGTP